jgi:hypothetical protein
MRGTNQRHSGGGEEEGGVERGGKRLAGAEHRRTEGDRRQLKEDRTKKARTCTQEGRGLEGSNQRTKTTTKGRYAMNDT